MPNTNSQTTKNNNLQDDLEFDKLYRGEIDEINKEMGLFLPPKLSPEMTSVWEEFFDVLRYMYAFEVLDLFYIRKYLFDFFEMAKKEPDELERKKAAVQVMRQKAKESANKQKEILRLFYENQYTKNIEKIYNELESDEEKIEFLTYLNNGEIPAEVQSLIDERDAENNEESQLSPEEIDELQRNAIQNIFSKYNNSHGKLNLGKTGNVVSAEAIDEFINQKEAEEAESLRAQTKIRTIPNLPNSVQNPNSTFGQTFDQNLRNNQNPQNSNFTNSQNLTNSPNNSGFSNNQNNLSNNSQNLPSNQQFVPQNNIANLGQNSTNPNNSNINNLHNPKAIPPRTRGLNDLLKK
jgi:hypothetical protein